MTSLNISSALMPITARPDVVMVRGKGSTLWDYHNNRYLDFIQGWAVNSLGHAPAEIIDALCQQSKILITPSPALHNQPQQHLADLLAQLSGLSQVHFSNSGSEANEVAVKLARRWARLNKPGAFEVITTENAFHGRTLAMMAACGKPGWDEIFPPIMPGFKKVPFGDSESLREAITPKTAAIMVEPIQGEAGGIIPPVGYLRELRTLADEHNLLLILDEVQTGCGRTGKFFAFEHEGITPDVVTLGKGLGGGVPISATLAASRACCFEHGDQGGTYNGNPLMCAVALALAQVVSEPGFLQQVQTSGEKIKAGLLSLRENSQAIDTRGQGLLLGINLPTAVATQVQEDAFNNGLLINAPRPATLRLMPALNIDGEDIDNGLGILKRCVNSALAAPAPARE